MELGRLEDAVRAADQSLTLDAEQGRASYAKGEVLRRGGRARDARPLLEAGAAGSLAAERWLRLAQCAAELETPSVGQIVGRMNQLRPARQVLSDMVDEYLDTVERMAGLMKETDNGT